ELLQERHAVHLGHVDVAHDQLEAVVPQLAQAFDPISGGVAAVAAVRKPFREDIPYGLVVIDNENVRWVGHRLDPWIQAATHRRSIENVGYRRVLRNGTGAGRGRRRARFQSLDSSLCMSIQFGPTLRSTTRGTRRG